MIRKVFACCLSMTLGLGIAAGEAGAASGDTVKTIRDRGSLLCTGHNGSYFGFAEVDDKGAWKGFDIELCRALATAILGSPDKVEIIPVSWAQRFPALQSGDVDVIIKVTGWTMTRDTELGFQFSRPYFLGATQMITHKSNGAGKIADLDGGTFCIAAGTTIERISVDYLGALGIDYETLTFEKPEELRGAFFAGRCDAFGGFGPFLAATRSQAANPDDYIILPDVIALEPEGIVSRQGDDNFVDVVNWMISVMQMAELNGISSENVDEMKANPPSASIERLLGATPGIGARLGLDDSWAYNVIKQVGNYAEVFERTLGGGSPYQLPRGVNALYTEGGLHYPLVLD